jgi:sugar phosphate isomerase/epimerase
MRDGHKFEFIHDLKGTWGLIAAIDQPNTGVLLDSWQWYTSHGTTADLEALAPGDVTYVHLNDAPAGLAIDDQIDDQRMLPGATGVIDVDAFVDALRRIEFNGPIAVEPYNAALNSRPAGERVNAAFESVTKVLRVHEV